jgi:hypothetical protein
MCTKALVVCTMSVKQTFNAICMAKLSGHHAVLSACVPQLHVLRAATARESCCAALVLCTTGCYAWVKQATTTTTTSITYSRNSTEAKSVCVIMKVH